MRTHTRARALKRAQTQLTKPNGHRMLIVHTFSCVVFVVSTLLHNKIKLNVCVYVCVCSALAILFVIIIVVTTNTLCMLAVHLHANNN